MSSILFRVYMLAILATLLLFSACAPTYYNPNTRMVRQVTNRAEVENCEFMRIVFAREINRGTALNKIRSAAADFGGDHFLVVFQDVEEPITPNLPTWYTFHAESYNCGQ